MDERLRRLRAVLASQTFPAERWELLAAAEFYGADARTRAELRGIPAGRYPTIAHVAEAARVAIARSLALRPRFLVCDDASTMKSAGDDGHLIVNADLKFRRLVAFKRHSSGHQHS